MGHEPNENGASFQASLHHQSQENTSPLPFGFERKEDAWSRLRTHTKKRKQPLEDSMAQKILKALDEHGEC